jgi:hypothetical protein
MGFVFKCLTVDDAAWCDDDDINDILYIFISVCWIFNLYKQGIQLLYQYL